MTLKVAIVGAGIIGDNHAKAILLHPELTVTALVAGSEMLPGFTRRYFGSAQGTGEAVAVVESAPPGRLIFRSDPRLPVAFFPTLYFFLNAAYRPERPAAITARGGRLRAWAKSSR